ncbi:ABC transporter ATP-binding protein [Ancylomarina sp. YFZ004]
MTKPFILIENLYKSYKSSQTKALNGLNLNVSRGTIHALLGPNGAGKTSSINILCGLLKQDSGKVTIAGFKVPEQKKHIKKLIGLVPQDIALYPELTAYENLMFFGSMYRIPKNELKIRIELLLKELGLFEKRNNQINSYSGGMKRRINLIAGLLHSPEILILDEPTVGIDIQSKLVILNFLKETNKKGTTIIYTSHHLAEAEKFCDYISIIDHGVVIEEGLSSNLLNKYPNYNNLEEIFIHLTGKKLRD